MKTSNHLSFQQQVEQVVATLPDNAVFYSTELPFASEKRKALSKVLSHLTTMGILVRMEPGFYGKVREGMLGLGPIGPSTYEILPKLLKHQKQHICYLTGMMLYLNLHLTFQMPWLYEFATDKPRRPFDYKGCHVRFVRSRISEPVVDVYPLQILDAITDIDQILGASYEHKAIMLWHYLRRMTPTQRKAVKAYSLFYPPHTQDLLKVLLQRSRPYPSRKWHIDL
jgi:hypothetical protein